MKLDIRDLIINIINREKILIKIYKNIFLDFKYIFCV